MQLGSTELLINILRFRRRGSFENNSVPSKRIHDQITWLRKIVLNHIYARSIFLIWTYEKLEPKLANFTVDLQSFTQRLKMLDFRLVRTGLL